MSFYLIKHIFQVSSHPDQLVETLTKIAESGSSPDVSKKIQQALLEALQNITKSQVHDILGPLLSNLQQPSLGVNKNNDQVSEKLVFDVFLINLYRANL